MADTTFIDQQTVVYADWLQDVNNHVYRSTTVNSINSKTGPVALLGGANVTIDNSVAGQVTISATGGGGGGVTNVNGKTGAVTLAAGTNVTLDTSGSNIVINATGGGGGGVTSFNTRTGVVSLTSTDVTNAIGFTPYNATNPSGYVAAASSPTFTGRVFGNGGGSGLGQITLTTTAGTPTGGSVGDIKLVY